MIERKRGENVGRNNTLSNVYVCIILSVPCKGRSQKSSERGDCKKKKRFNKKQNKKQQERNIVSLWCSLC